MNGFWDTLFAIPSNIVPHQVDNASILDQSVYNFDKSQSTGLYPISEYKSLGPNLDIKSFSVHAKPYSPYSDIYASPFQKYSDSILDWLSYSGKTQNPVVQGAPQAPPQSVNFQSDRNLKMEVKQSQELCSGENLKWCVILGLVVTGVILKSILKK